MSKTVKTILLILSSIFLFPAAVFEYFLLLWYWAGDGLFMLVAVPVFFTVFLLLHIPVYRRIPKQQQSLKALSIFSMILLTPILTVSACYILAWLCGIPIGIH